jgi:hypothetical protein
MRIRLMLALVGVMVLSMAFAAPASAAIRGYVVPLTGAAEPNGGDPDGIGVSVITVNDGLGRVCWATAAKRITLPAAASHIHVGVAGQNGPIVVPLTPPGARGFTAGCASVDPVLALAINTTPSDYYVNVHTSDFPGGAIRGQLH